MKIVIDARCLMEGRRTGVEEYTLGLLESLFELDKKNQYILFLNSWKKPNFDSGFFARFENVRIKRLKIPNKLLNLFFWYLAWPKIDLLCGGADIVFMPNITFGAVSWKAKLVLVVHDLSFERHSEYFSRKRRWWHTFVNARQACKKADKIIAVSRSTEKDLINLYGIRKEKIEMVHSAVGKDFRIVNRNDAQLVRVKEKYALPYRFILSLGTIEPRKNIAGTVRAYNALQAYAEKNKREDLLKYELIIAGESGWNARDIFFEIRHSPFRKKIRVLRSIPSGDKPYLYNLASLFVYPSFFEGFGFPPLEAMNCGVPVITSNNSSLPEITADAAILIDPDKPDELYQAMREILSDQKLRDGLIEKGLKRSKEFDWLTAGKKTLRVFDELK